jgi:hypothetical protein
VIKTNTKSTTSENNITIQSPIVIASSKPQHEDQNYIVGINGLILGLGTGIDVPKYLRFKGINLALENNLRKTSE